MTKKQAADAEVDGYDIFKCLSCADTPEFDFIAMKDHLHNVHQIDTDTTPMSVQMTMHMDGRTWSSSDYRLEIGDVSLARSIRTPRDMDDMMRYA